MPEAVQQIPMQLQPAEPYALKYFVTHSGVISAFGILEEATNAVLNDEQSFRSIYLYGPNGSGKTHLVEGFAAHLRSQGLAESKVNVLNLDALCDESGQVDDAKVPSIVRLYESSRTSGGIILVSALVPPSEISKNPHLTSRLLSGDVSKVSLPAEAEMEPVLRSLLERRNLKLSERTLNYVLTRLPLNPLSFDGIFAQINETSLERSVPAGPAIAREVMNLGSKKS